MFHDSNNDRLTSSDFNRASVARVSDVRIDTAFGPFDYIISRLDTLSECIRDRPTQLAATTDYSVLRVYSLVLETPASNP